jgi:hypothetical protein
MQPAIPVLKDGARLFLLFKTILTMCLYLRLRTVRYGYWALQRA